MALKDEKYAREHSFQKWHLSAFNILSHVYYYLGANTGTGFREATIMKDAAWIRCSPCTYLGNYLMCKPELLYPHCSGASTICNIILMEPDLCVCMYIHTYIYKGIYVRTSCQQPDQLQQIEFSCWFKRHDKGLWKHSLDLLDMCQSMKLFAIPMSPDHPDHWETRHTLNTTRKDEETTVVSRWPLCLYRFAFYEPEEKSKITAELIILVQWQKDASHGPN